MSCHVMSCRFIPPHLPVRLASRRSEVRLRRGHLLDDPLGVDAAPRLLLPLALALLLQRVRVQDGALLDGQLLEEGGWVGKGEGEGGQGVEVGHGADGIEDEG